MAGGVEGADEKVVIGGGQDMQAGWAAGRTGFRRREVPSGMGCIITASPCGSGHPAGVGRQAGRPRRNQGGGEKQARKADMAISGRRLLKNAQISLDGEPAHEAIMGPKSRATM